MSTLVQDRNFPPPLVIPRDATEAQRALSYERSPGVYGISPNALKTYRHNPVAYFFRYCGPRSMKWPDWGQTAPMAIGSAVDGLAKQALVRHWWRVNRRRDFRKRVNQRTFSIYGTVRPDGRKEKVRRKAYSIFEGLVRTPIWRVIEQLRCVDLERDVRTAQWVHGAPLNGKLDFLFYDDHVVGDPDRIIADLKVNGAFTKSGSTPIPGYSMRYDYDPATDTVYECEPHERAGEPMENLHYEYATQLASYCLMEDGIEQGSEEPYIGLDDRVMLIQVTFGAPRKEPKIRKDGTRRDWLFSKGRITFTLIDTHVSGDFKRQILEDYRELWAGYRARTIVPDWLARYGEQFLWMLQGRPTLTNPAEEV